MDNLIIAEKALAILKDFKFDVLKKEEWYMAIQPSIKAELLYGSVAKGTNNPNSDIDMLIILPLEIEEKYTSGEYFYNYKGYIINIVLRSVEKLRIIASEGKNTFQQEIFEKSVLLFQKDNEVLKLVDIIIGKDN
jgi:predicted nucleotidyltransferase